MGNHRLTIEQTLQQGVAAHKEGKLQEAERLYKAILQSQPAHADANHNLGVIAVSANKADVALPLFKTALEANPKIEQFWLSYIDALIKEKQFDNTKQVLEQAKNQGLVGEKIDALEEHLTLITQASKSKLPEQKKSLTLSEKRKKLAEQKKQKKAKKQNLKAINPSEAEITSLLNNYQTGQYGDAEKLAVSITQEFPKHQFAWKVLGAILKQTGRVGESLVPSQKSVQLAPQDAEAHNNLGGTLQELGRLNESKVSYTQAVALKPDYAEAHYNLGMTLQELGRLDEAVASYTQSIVLEPEYAKAHNSLLRCLYLLDKEALFFDKLDYFINADTANASIGSLTCRSALKYGVEKPNLFCREPLQYVLHIDMNTQYDFEGTFVEKARLILNENRIPNRKQSLLVNGYQTSGNLFDIKNSFTEEIQKAIRSEIEKYRISFKNSKDGLIKKWPTDYSLYGWLISMKSGGELKPHIHENGWLSGSLYINVPPKSKTESGNLVVSLGEEKDATETRINVEKIINVVTGSLVLFPASLTHYTIPFEAEEERIVLAFDVK
jgi:Flp pilus assembly protein TadD